MKITHGTSIKNQPRSTLVFLTSDAGKTGIGEGTPLPGYSLDSPAECHWDIERINKAIAENGLTIPEGPIHSSIPQLLDTLNFRSCSARFAIETAILDLIAQRDDLPMWRILNPAAEMANPRPLNMLITTAVDLQKAEDLGIQTGKVKLGRLLWEQELLHIENLRKRAGNSFHFRVDVNGRWFLSEAETRLWVLKAMKFELCEEPVAFHELTKLSSELPVALDETLTRFAGSKIPVELLQGPVQTLVLKPMLLGGNLRCLALAAQAHEYGLDTIVTHMMDGPVGMCAAAHLALALGPGKACGLADHTESQYWPSRLQAPNIGTNKLIYSQNPGIGISWN